VADIHNALMPLLKAYTHVLNSFTLTK